jgi:hypothetical protein
MNPQKVVLGQQFLAGFQFFSDYEPFVAAEVEGAKVAHRELVCLPLS